MHVMTVVGARPQFVKASVVSAALSGRGGIRETLVHTGQHFDPNMSRIFFDELDLKAPDFHLGIHSGSHGAMTGRMLEALEPLMIAQTPDVVLVYGDTNSTLAGALDAAKLHIPVAHVESGLRSFNRRMPEEINRVMTDHLSALLFAPTSGAVQQLVREGIDRDAIVQVGDVMYDAALLHRQLSENRTGPLLDRLGLRAQGYVLATVHREENTADSGRLQVIVEAFRRISATWPVLWPMHPRTHQALRLLGLLESLPKQLVVIEPVGYLDMAVLEAQAVVIATDSGGVQKESYFHGVPCVTLREETEWIDLLELGWNRLAPPTSAESVEHAVLSACGTRGRDASPFGDGHAAERIAESLASGRLSQ